MCTLSRAAAGLALKSLWIEVIYFQRALQMGTPRGNTSAASSSIFAGRETKRAEKYHQYISDTRPYPTALVNDDVQAPLTFRAALT